MLPDLESIANDYALQNEDISVVEPGREEDDEIAVQEEFAEEEARARPSKRGSKLLPNNGSNNNMAMMI